MRGAPISSARLRCEIQASTGMTYNDCRNDDDDCDELNEEVLTVTIQIEHEGCPIDPEFD